MAIVRSIGVGKGRKSAGDVTYAVVRGRTIMKSRIVENKSNTKLQADNRQAFKKMSQYATLLDPWIKRNYEKSKYGSSRNLFISTNKEQLKTALVNVDVTNITMNEAYRIMIRNNMYTAVGIDASMVVTYEKNEAGDLTVKTTILDNNFTKVEFYSTYISAAGNNILVVKREPILNNGFWELTFKVNNFNTNAIYIMMAFADEKPITTNSAAIIG